ncbi:MAG: hypothetical protein GY788_08905 [bacterium]|nr:hypothetical protein [bacterium]
MIDPTATADTPFTFQFIHDRKGAGGKQPRILHGTFKNLWPEIERHNKAGFGSFVVVNETNFLGRKAANIVRVRALFADADSPEAVARCEAAFLDTGAIPTMVVGTSPGRKHYYWCVDNVPLDQFSALQRALAARLGTDSSVCDLPRVMRLPGTLHLKGEPHPVTLEEVSGKRWASGALVKTLGLDLSKARSRTARKGSPAGGSIFLKSEEPFEVGLARVQRIFGKPKGPSALAAGLTFNIDKLRSAVMAIPAEAITDEGDWMRLARGMAHQAVKYPSQAEEIYAILDEKSKQAPPSYDAENNRNRFDRHRDEALARAEPIAIATVFWLARKHGWEGWQPPPEVRAMALERAKAEGLSGGVFESDMALAKLNGHFFVGVTDGEISIFRANDDGTAAHMLDRDFKLLTENMLVAVGRDGNLMSAERFFRTHPRRRQLRFVFKTHGSVAVDEFNLWRGFAVTPVRGWRKQRRLVCHIFKVICRGDKAKFRYLMRWLAWSVQHPGEQPETVVMLKSGIEGSGKSTLGVVMCRLFGPHGRIIDDRDQLLGKFNGGLDTACFILADEILFAGDLRIADKLKSRITSAILPLEEKYRNPRQVPNRMSVLMTSNHEHAAALGVRDRRFFVLEVSGEHAQEKSWFDPLYRDLEGGGYEQFLWLLQNLRLEDWHPRELVKTPEAIEQERMSGDSIDQWARACIDADGLVGLPPGLGFESELGCVIPTEALRESYTGFCRQQALRAAGTAILGRALAEMFGPKKRLPEEPDGRRPWGYDVLTADVWSAAADKRRGGGI